MRVHFDMLLILTPIWLIYVLKWINCSYSHSFLLTLSFPSMENIHLLNIHTTPAPPLPKKKMKKENYFHDTAESGWKSSLPSSLSFGFPLPNSSSAFIFTPKNFFESAFANDTTFSFSPGKASCWGRQQKKG